MKKINLIIFIASLACITLDAAPTSLTTKTVEHKKTLILLSGLAAGSLTATMIDNMIEAYIGSDRVVLRLASHLLAETSLGFLTFVIGYQMGKIRLNDKRVVYDHDFDTWTTCFQLGFNIREVLRCGCAYANRLSTNHGDIIKTSLILDDVYGFFHVLAGKANAQEVIIN